MALWSVGQVFVGEVAGISLLATVAIGLPPTMWLIHDVKRHGRFLPHIVYPFILAFWAILVPGYVVWTRKFRGLKLVTIHVLLTSILTIVLYNITIYLAWGPRTF